MASEPLHDVGARQEDPILKQVPMSPALKMVGS